MLGVITTSKTFGTIKVKEHHAEMFAREGRTDLVEGIESPALKAKEIKPKKKKGESLSTTK